MIIGFLSLEIFLPYSQSLKDKRKIIKSFKDRMSNRYNVALAELDFQAKWQRTRIGLVTINSHKKPVDRLFTRILKEAEETLEGEIIDSQIYYF